MAVTIPSTTPILRFNSYPEFTPFYSPLDMLSLGIFGKNFFFKNANKTGLERSFLNDPLVKENSGSIYAESNNYFQVSPETIALLITVPYRIKSLYGNKFFNWYCRFLYGKTNPDHSAYFIECWNRGIRILYSYVKENPTDLDLYKPYRQAMLELGWDPTKDPDNPS